MPSWTKEQQTAIDTRDKTLLVSAAAGSGKTATLTERIIRSLTDEKNPTTIDSLLVVTFTKSAASELRQKISLALTGAVRENPDNQHLKRQLYMLPSAKICTIDSYCAEILRQNCERVGIAPGYRIAEGVECELLASSILSGLISEIYEGRLAEVATPEELFSLSECLTDAKNTESINDRLRSLYKSLESTTEGVGTLRSLLSLYDAPLDASPHLSYIKDRLHECAEHYLCAFGKLYNELSSGNEYELGVSGTCAADIAILKTLVSKNDYKTLRDLLLNIKFTTLFSKRGAEKTAPILDFAALRAEMKDDLLDYKNYFLYTEKEIVTLLGALRTKSEVLCRILEKFDRLFTTEKYRLGALSFADVERLAYECLWQDGEPTDVAFSIRASISAVYIDEYQDVNDIQNKIFEAISREDNRFMVGDVKQSIYRFRNANPDIFTSTKKSLPDLASATVGASLFMSKNFRSDKAIIDFVNSIFDRVFALAGESIDYREDDRLSFGKGGDPEYRTPEVCVVTKRAPEDDGYISEPRAVALKIKSLLDTGKLNSGEPIEPKDIAIILRSTKTKGAQYAEELSKLGIPARLSGDKDFFFSSEVLLALCLLNSIDNPRRDVYLAGLMTSPLYSFTHEELYKIKSSAPADSLYSSLSLYADVSGDEKCRDFLSALSHYRSISEGISIDVLLYRLYRETGLFALAKKSSGGDNLRLLYDYARRFAEGEFKGLYSFISFINSIEDKETSFDDKRDAANAHSVEIITAHSSKGLEYPVVFFANASGKFKNHESSSRLAFSRKLGVGMKLRAEDSLALVNNPVYDIICHHTEREDYEEELRILYVVLTRAKERLFITGTSPKDDREKYESEMLLSSEHLSRYSVRQQKSFMDIILSASGSAPIDEGEFLLGLDRELTAEIPHPAPDAPKNETDESLYAMLSERFGFKYPYIYETTLPEKLSVSKASPTVLDGTEGDYSLLGVKKNEDEVEFREHLPAFIEGREADESAKRGIATHYFLQFCDLERFCKIGAEAELSALLSGGFISARDAERVRISEIKKFKESRLFSDMLEAKNLYRELRFNIHIPCKYFTEDEIKLEGLSDETILVQGVIDCVIEYPDGSFGVFDYKTDRLTREELASRHLAEERMAKSHRRQLEYYAIAVEQIFGKRPTRIEVYSLHFGDNLSVGIL